MRVYGAFKCTYHRGIAGIRKLESQSGAKLLLLAKEALTVVIKGGDGGATAPPTAGGGTSRELRMETATLLMEGTQAQVQAAREAVTALLEADVAATAAAAAAAAASAAEGGVSGAGEKGTVAAVASETVYVPDYAVGTLIGTGSCWAIPCCSPHGS